jgi:hypothetical protein
LSFINTFNFNMMSLHFFKYTIWRGSSVTFSSFLKQISHVLIRSETSS